MEYTIIRSSRKTIAIEIKPDGEVVVRCPRRMHKENIHAFVQSKSTWIFRHLEKLPDGKEPILTNEELNALKEQTRRKVTERAAYYAPIIGVSYSQIAVRAQHTRWGSCSGKGNLNFNCLLALVPEDVLDYVVVHELCHRKQMNHSEAFWREVEAVLPDYKQCKLWLQKNGRELIAKLPK